MPDEHRRLPDDVGSDRPRSRSPGRSGRASYLRRVADAASTGWRSPSRRCGVGKGNNVGVMAVNSAQFVEIYYATAALGATFVPLNFRAKPEELTYMINTADVNVLFISERYYPLLQEIRRTLAGVEHVFALGFEGEGLETFDALVESGEDIPVFTDIEEDDASLLIYTSGTTAMPKGVELSYHALTGLVVNTQNPPDPSSEQEVVLVVGAVLPRRRRHDPWRARSSPVAAWPSCRSSTQRLAPDGGAREGHARLRRADDAQAHHGGRRLRQVRPQLAPRRSPTAPRRCPTRSCAAPSMSSRPSA